MQPEGFGNFNEQLDSLFEFYFAALKKQGLGFDTGIWANFYISDASNEEDALRESVPFKKFQDNGIATSIIQMPPGMKKVALHAYNVQTNHPIKRKKIPIKGMKSPCSAYAVDMGGQKHIYLRNAIPRKGGAIEDQAHEAFTGLADLCHDHGLSMNDVVRIWLYVSNIDSNYLGMNAARNIVFDSEGVNVGKRFPASTGIEGRSRDAEDLILLDAELLATAKKGQVTPMKALSQLNPTTDYSVRFERGLKITYADRTHFYISGTASISGEGEILYKGDVIKQADRTLENINSLLENSGGLFDNLSYMIVYIRDMSDFNAVEEHLSKRLKDIPHLTTQAPVCRPGWLIEIEGVAISSKGDPAYSPY